MGNQESVSSWSRIANGGWNLNDLFSDTSGRVSENSQNKILKSENPFLETLVGETPLPHPADDFWRHLLNIRWPDRSDVISPSDFQYILKVGVVKKLEIANLKTGNVSKLIRSFIFVLQQQIDSSNDKFDFLFGLSQLIFFILNHFISNHSFPSLLLNLECSPVLLETNACLGWDSVSNPPQQKIDPTKKALPSKVSLNIRVTIPAVYKRQKETEPLKNVDAVIQLPIIKHGANDQQQLSKLFTQQLKKLADNIFDPEVRECFVNGRFSFCTINISERKTKSSESSPPSSPRSSSVVVPTIVSLSLFLSNVLMNVDRSDMSVIPKSSSDAHYRSILIPHCFPQESTIRNLMRTISRFLISSHYRYFFAKESWPLKNNVTTNTGQEFNKSENLEKKEKELSVEDESNLDTAPVPLLFEIHKTNLSTLFLCASVMSVNEDITFNKNSDQNIIDDSEIQKKIINSNNPSLFLLDLFQSGESTMACHQRMQFLESIKMSLDRTSMIIHSQQNDKDMTESTPPVDKTFVDLGPYAAALSACQPYHRIQQHVDDILTSVNDKLANSPEEHNKKKKKSKSSRSSENLHACGLKLFLNSFSDDDENCSRKDFLTYLMHMMFLPIIDQNYLSSNVLKFFSLKAPSRSTSTAEERLLRESFLNSSPNVYGVPNNNNSHLDTLPSTPRGRNNNNSKSLPREIGLDILFMSSSSLFHSIRWPEPLLSSETTKKSLFGAHDSWLLETYGSFFSQFPLSLFFDVVPLSGHFAASAFFLTCVYADHSSRGFAELFDEIFQLESENNEDISLWQSSPDRQSGSERQNTINVFCVETIRSTFAKLNDYSRLQSPLMLFVFYTFCTRNSLTNRTIPFDSPNLEACVSPLLRMLSETVSASIKRAHSENIISQNSHLHKISFMGSKMRSVGPLSVTLILTILVNWTKDSLLAVRLFSKKMDRVPEWFLSEGLGVPQNRLSHFASRFNSTSLGHMMIGILYRTASWNMTLALDANIQELVSAVLLNLASATVDTNWSISEYVIKNHESWTQSVVSRVPRVRDLTDEISAVFSAVDILSSHFAPNHTEVVTASQRVLGSVNDLLQKKSSHDGTEVPSDPLDVKLPKISLHPADLVGNSLAPILTQLSVGMSWLAVALTPPNLQSNASLLYTHIRQNKESCQRLCEMCQEIIQSDVLSHETLTLVHSIWVKYGQLISTSASRSPLLALAESEGEGEDNDKDRQQDDRTSPKSNKVNNLDNEKRETGSQMSVEEYVIESLGIRIVTIFKCLSYYHFLKWNIATNLRIICDISALSLCQTDLRWYPDCWIQVPSSFLLQKSNRLENDQIEENKKVIKVDRFVEEKIHKFSPKETADELSCEQMMQVIQKHSSLIYRLYSLWSFVLPPEDSLSHCDEENSSSEPNDQKGGVDKSFIKKMKEMKTVLNEITPDEFYALPFPVRITLATAICSGDHSPVFQFQTRLAFPNTSTLSVDSWKSCGQEHHVILPAVWQILSRSWIGDCQPRDKKGRETRNNDHSRNLDMTKKDRTSSLLLHS